MAATEYKPVTWADNQPIWTETLNQMTNNEQWLYENTPRMRFRGAGSLPNRSNGTKLLAGFAPIAKTKESNNGVNIYFNDYFTSGCYPALAVAPISNKNARLTVVIHAIGGGLLPDHRGFFVRVFADEVDSKKNAINANMWVSWTAVGY